MRFLVVGLLAAAVVIPTAADAVTFPAACKPAAANQVRATRITASRSTGCKSGRLIVHHWILANFSRAKVGAYKCVFDTHGAHQRRGHCIAGKGTGVAFTLTEIKPA